MKSHKTSRVGMLPLLMVPVLMAGLMPSRSGAATLVVNNLADPGVGGCTAVGIGDGCTLREAIIDANNQGLTPGDDTVDVTGLSGTITLDAALPSLSTNIVLNGPGSTSLTVQRSSVGGTPEFRIFTIDNTTTSGPTVILSGFTLNNGKVSGGIAPDNSGGGIYNNHGTLTVSNCVLTNNSATNGGAICNDGSLSVNATLALSNSTLTNNTASSGGGALFNNGSNGGSTPLTISNCIFSSNSATNGGAILNDGHTGGSATITELSNSVLSTNTATGNGGAIENDGHAGGSATLVISNTTLSANAAVSGGGIDNNGSGGSATQAIIYSTFNANTASANGGAINNDGTVAGSATVEIDTSTLNANTAVNKGGAILSNGAGGSATVEIDNSTLKANTASISSAAIDWDGTGGNATLAMGSTILSNSPSANLFAAIINASTTFTSKNYNLSSDAAGGDGTSAPGGPYFSAGSDIRNTDPKLDSLKNNGGPTQTLALLSGSPAIDKGLSSFPTDQRGFVRPIDNPSITNASGGDGSDIGAYERAETGLSIDNVTVTEGNSGTVDATFTVTLSDPNVQTVTVDYATAIPGTYPATPGADYVATSGTLSFAPGETTKTITVKVNGDLLNEGIERFFVILSNSTNALILDDEGSGTITDDDAKPSLSINDVTALEGNAGTTNFDFTVSLSAASGQTVTVKYATGTPSGIAATPGDDYTAQPLTTLTFAPGETIKTVTVLVNGDTTVEGDERFVVKLSTSNNATISDSEGFGTILEDDTYLSINNVIVTEGNSGTVNATFTVSLTAASSKTVTVKYATGTLGSVPATAGVDYVAVPLTTLTFAPGQTSKTVTVKVNGDTLNEVNERFAVNLSSSTNAYVADSEGIGTITDDDAVPSLSIDDVTQAEGNSGTTAFTFTVTLSAASGKSVTVKYATATPTATPATAGTDYTAVALTTLTFASGETTKTVTVLVNGDTTVEGNERFLVKLSTSTNATISDSEGFGTITNDDAAAPLLFQDDAPSE